ncbi:hypothetical protein [Bradyrhizobium ottawaense]|uniref:CobQ/CobB/MinD/ParA nucleotide binding domain-containing protein n=1 Tax=Bradyrhizobium ottawaense TaxID=931866 RepID=A0ABY0QHB3_9BRAD|nr:hypothetical protein [Bradyrhizobium ottawaense]SDK41026.1 CobQ/CobB/MinD/ParA nucleotide binding domain-containing protein [Bradyrhizobium ottawaense]
MNYDRRRSQGLSEVARRQRQEALEKSLWHRANYSASRRETTDQKPVEEPRTTEAPAPIEQPKVIIDRDHPKVVQTKKEDRIRMGLPHVVIVGADKGGVGKTFVSRAVMDYFKAQGATVRAFDTQQPDGNLKRFFPAETEVVNLSTSDDQIKVFDTVGKNDVTVIDIQAGLLTPTLELLTDIAFFDLVTEGKLNVSVLHVIGSTIQSFNEIEGTAKLLQGVRHFVVTNHTNDAAFFKGIAGVSTDVLSGADFRIDIAKLDERATEYVEAANATFADYAKNGESFVMKGKVNKWLNDTKKAFEAAKLNIK